MVISLKRLTAIIALLFSTAYFAVAQTSPSSDNQKTKPVMKTYLIEREMPNVGKLNQAELKAASQKSCSVLAELGPNIEWVHSYVTGNKIFCIYKAENEEVIREHGKKAGFPVNNVTEIATIISPATAKQ